MNKYVSEKKYLSLVVFLPIIALLLGLVYREIERQTLDTFSFSLSINYYIPIFVLGSITFFYSVLILYSKKYNESKFFKIVVSLYLFIFILLQVLSFNSLFLSKLMMYKGLNVFIMLNLVIYFVLAISKKL